MAVKVPKLGFCNLCAEEAELTLEHIPPQSAGNDKWAAVHTINGLHLGSRFNKMPPLLECRSGMGRRSLCKRCNEFTAKYYNDAFAEWTLQASVYAQKVGDDNWIAVPFSIKPLNVIKQIMTMAIAAGDVGHSTPLSRIRRFILTPYEQYLPPDVAVRAYLNPARAHRKQDRMLSQNRMATSGAMMDLAKGTSCHFLAEIAFPPMGYLVVFTDPTKRMMAEIAELEDISFFGRFRYDEERALSVRLPVRIPFGPAPGHYPKI